MELVPVPVVEPCVSAVKIPARPTTNVREGMTSEQKVAALAKDLEDKEDYILTAENLLANCAKRAK